MQFLLLIDNISILIFYQSLKEDYSFILQSLQRGKQMTYRQKTQQFKKSIRKQQIHQFFASKRILLAEGLPVQMGQSPLIREHHSLVSHHILDFDIDDIKRLAKLSETEPGIQSIAQSGSISVLVKYLSAQYHDSDRQYYATIILCNYYYMEHSQLPNQVFINQILQILQGNDIRIVGNCIILLTNIIYDHPVFRDRLVKQKMLAVKITRLFEIQKVTTNYYISLITLIYRTIYKASFQLSFKHLIPPLSQILSSTQILELDLIKPALSCFNLLANMFASDIRKVIIQGRILQRLFFLVPMANDVKIINLTLQLICAILNQSLHSQFNKNILPFLNKIMLSSKQNKNLTQSRQFKLKIFKTIYFAIQEKLLAAKQFMEEPMANYMLEEFKSSDDSDILVELVYTFSLVLLNLGNWNHKNQNISKQIDSLIERAVTRMPDNLQILGYIQEVAYMREKDKISSV